MKNSQFAGYRLVGSNPVASTNPEWWKNDPIAQKTIVSAVEDMTTLAMLNALGGGDRQVIARVMDNEDFATAYIVVRGSTENQYKATGALAKVDITFKNSLTIRGLTISQHTKNGRLVVGMPYRLYTPTGSNQQSRAYDISFERAKQESFYAVVLQAVGDLFEQSKEVAPWQRQAKPNSEQSGDKATAAAGEKAINGADALGV